MRREIDQILVEEGREISALAQQLRTRAIALDVWALQMRERITTIHLYSAAAAKGGWAQMTSADFGRVGQVVRSEYGHLERFAAQIEAGKPLDGIFLRRVDQYVQSGRRTYELTRRASMRELGFTEARSVLHPADHCDECVREAELGYRDVADIVPVGERQCLRNCRCTIEYRDPETGAVAA